jgi:preprotein translocase subunit SecG
MTSLVLFAGIFHTLFGLMLFFTALFLILLILVQRGRGGGLSGAFGGMGGQSAFGSKAGDTFTFITIIVATFWILLCIAGVAFMKGAGSDSKFDTRPPEDSQTTPSASDAEPRAGETPDEPATEEPEGPALGEPAAPTTSPDATPAQDGPIDGEGD